MEVDRLEILVQSEASKAISELDKLQARLLTIKGTLGSVNSSVNGSLSGAGTSTSTSNGYNVINRSARSLTSQLSKLAIGFFTVRKGIQLGMSSIKSSMNFGETVNLFQTAFRKIGLDAGKEFEFAFLEKAQAVNDKLSDAFGLDPNVLMNYQARFAQMANSMGTVGKTALNISTSFTALGEDIASLFNIDVETAMLKLQSGLSGQIRPLRQIGVDISKTSLEQTAWNYGIKDSYEKMSAASKVQLRFLTTMQQLRIAMGDMARTINSPANQIRILKNQWELLSRSMGNMFLPILTQIMPYLNGLMIALRGIIQSIAEFLGWKMPDWTTSNIFMGDTSAADDASDAIDGATESVNKYKRSVLGVDQLNILSKQSDSSSTKDTTGSGYSVLDTAIAKETENYMKELDKQIAKMKNTSLQFAKEIEPKLKSILKVIGFVGAGLLAWKISKNLMSDVGLISTFFKLFGKGEVAGGILSTGVGASTAAAGFSTLGIAAFGVSVAFAHFYDVYHNTVKPAFDAINNWSGGKFRENFQPIIDTFKEFLIPAQFAKDGVDLFGSGISDVTKNKVKPFTEKMKELSNTITTIDWTGKIIKQSDVEDVRKKTSDIVSIITNELDSDKNSALSALSPLKDALDKKAYDDLINDNSSYYTKIKKKVTDGESQINIIMDTARKENRSLTEEEAKKINDIRASIEDEGVKHLSETETEYTKIMTRLKDNTISISLQQGSEIIKNSKETRDSAITNAQIQYDSVVSEANKMLNAGSITKSEYDKIIFAADLTKQKTVDAANNQYDSIYNTTISKLGNTSKYIDSKTGEILTNWQEFCNSFKSSFSDMFTIKIPETFKKILEWLANLSGKSISVDASTSSSNNKQGKSLGEQLKTNYTFGSSVPALPKLYANGGIPKYGELFSSRENGIPEFVGRYGNKTGVMNNEQIVDSVSSGVAQAVKSVLGNGMSSAGDIIIQILNESGVVTGSKVIKAAERTNQKQGKILIPI